MRAQLERQLNRLWYCHSPLAKLLWPLSLPFLLLSLLRRKFLLFRSSQKLPVPVVVVGNITVGGSGKTPLVLAVSRYLACRGLRVGVISRGYGGSAEYPLRVLATTPATQSGDEPLLMARRGLAPVVVSPDRLAAAALVLEEKVDVIVSDDGLQHYRLPRDIEIVVVDGERGLGNGLCLPAGPLREAASRLSSVDLVVANGDLQQPLRQGCHVMLLQPGALLSVLPDSSREAPHAGERVHAVAAIGNPERFFHTLQQLGFEVIRHPFPDHHPFTESELLFPDGLPVVMTEKDAVKCGSFAGLSRHWYLPVEAVLPEAFWLALQQKLDTIRQEK